MREKINKETRKVKEKKHKGLYQVSMGVNVNESVTCVCVLPVQRGFKKL